MPNCFNKCKGQFQLYPQLTNCVKTSKEQESKGEKSTFNFFVFKKYNKIFFQCIKYDGEIYIVVEVIVTSKNGDMMKVLLTFLLNEREGKYGVDVEETIEIPADKTKYTLEGIEDSKIYDEDETLLKNLLPGYNTLKFPENTNSNGNKNDTKNNSNKNDNTKIIILVIGCILVVVIAGIVIYKMNN